MHVVCPKCQATYQVDANIPDAILVCHRCQTEFSAQGSRKEPEAKSTTPKNPIALQRKKARLWPWLTFVLCCLTGWGAFHYKDVWIQQTWVRNILLQAHYPLTPQPSDWLLLNQDTHRQWMERQDKSRVLVLTGMIKNQLMARQPLPALEVRFFDAPNTASTQTLIMPITEPPGLPQIRHAPYHAPKADLVPVAAHATRPFTLVIEDVPEHTREFSVSVSRHRP